MSAPTWAEPLLRLFYPARCLFCQKPVTGKGETVCPLCRTGGLPFTPTGARFAVPGGVCVAPFYYVEPVRELMHRYKFRGRYKLAEPMAAYMADAAEGLPGFDLVSWVPVSAKRLRQRGYDQAQLLARALAGRLWTPLVPTLRKTRDAPPQTGFNTPEARRTNVSGAFAALPKAVADKRILLVDDILTTGATLGACVECLYQAGARSVVCAAFARAGDFGSKTNEDSAVRRGK
ncbi:MAG: ComF family protein [Oscillospiraceae bacterium]|jgi:ComF family protein|nr:ComF family protein [Oscillospiraceae bacterium]